MTTMCASTVFEQTQCVLNTHCDGLGHMNNVAYVQWAEDAAWAHSAALGLGLSVYLELGYAMVAHQHLMNYHAPCFAGECIRIRTWLSANDGLRLRRQYQFVRENDGQVVFSGHTDWVCVQLVSGKPKRMPPAFRDAYRLEST